MSQVRTSGCVAIIRAFMLLPLAAMTGVAATAQEVTVPAAVVSADRPLTYQNPVLHGDWSDPDVVRVGEDFYLTASSFVNVPGLPILHSRDLVHWTIIGHALARLPQEDHFRTPRKGGGVWAPAIRHHNGQFRIYYPDPDYGIYVVTASNPAGPWSAPTLVDSSPGAIDPAPFWDEDGRGWLIHGWARSRAGFANRLTLKPLDADGTRTVGEGVTVIDGATLRRVETSIGRLPWTTVEGPKLYHRDGWYYIFAPAGGVKAGWQAVFRSRSVTGPYEMRNVMDQGASPVNGPHQGAWVDTPTGEDWFLHFQDTDSYGRRVHLQPMAWHDGWPVIGQDDDRDGRGEPVLCHIAPRTSGGSTGRPQDSDDFGGPALSPAWQWSSNPGSDWADLSKRPGWLRLRAVSMPENLYEAGAILSQKLPAPDFTASVRLALAPQRTGESAGLGIFGDSYAWIGLQRRDDGVYLVRSRRPNAVAGAPEEVDVLSKIGSEEVRLMMAATPVEVAEAPGPEASPWPSMQRALHADVRFSYSLDGGAFIPVEGTFQSRQGRWVGAQIGLFSIAPSGSPSFAATSNGHADFDDFVVEVAPPAACGSERAGTP